LDKLQNIPQFDGSYDEGDVAPRKRQKVIYPSSPRASPRIPQFDGSADESDTDKRTSTSNKEAGVVEQTRWSAFVKPRFCSLFTQQKFEQMQREQLQEQEGQGKQSQQKPKTFSQKVQALRAKIAKTKKPNAPTKQALVEDIECTPTPNAKPKPRTLISPPLMSTLPKHLTTRTSSTTTTTTATTNNGESKNKQKVVKQVRWGSPLVAREEPVKDTPVRSVNAVTVPKTALRQSGPNKFAAREDKQV
jgi:hypothetical protein